MKIILSIFGIYFFLVGCGEEEPEQELSIFGTWQLVERYDGGSIIPNQAVEDGYLFTFESNLQCTTTHPTIGCPTNYEKLEGNFTISSLDGGKMVDIKLYCPALDDTDTIPNMEYYYEFVDVYLVLTPTARVNTCSEGCYEKFKKIAEAEVFTD